MKTLWIAAFSFALVALSGCGSKPAGTGNTAPKDGAAPAGSDTLAKIKKEGVLKWGADPSGGAPFVFTDPNDPDKVIGFELEIMEKLSKHLGLKHEIVRGQWDTLPANLLAGRSDMVMNGLEINEERKKKVSFSEPYFVYEQQLTVRAEDKDKYKSLEDLKGKNVGTLSGAEANNVLKAAGFAEENIKPYDDSFTPYRDLEAGRVDAVLQEDLIAAHYVKADKMPKLFNQPKTFAPGKYAVAVRPADKTLLDEVNKALDIMKKNGEIAEIYKKWNIWNERQKEVGIQEKK
ncbi:MAG TPA: transporter substrate-binding domain-containing protein [Planctomycetota bacterium]|nr:transporter substrate-binding domain-containing protein [Planctomycetota bacterium]